MALPVRPKHFMVATSEGKKQYHNNATFVSHNHRSVIHKWDRCTGLFPKMAAASATSVADLCCIVLERDRTEHPCLLKWWRAHSLHKWCTSSLQMVTNQDKFHCGNWNIYLFILFVPHLSQTAADSRRLFTSRLP